MAQALQFDPTPLPAAQPAARPTLTIVTPPSAARAPQPKARRGTGFALVVVSLALLAFVALCAAFPQWLATHSPTDMAADAVLQPPGADHWLGTDQFGRDVYSMVVYGARQSLLIGLAAVTVAGVIGVGIGLLAGYAGGWVDAVLMRATDIWMAVPNLLLAIAIATALGPGVLNTILAISVAAIPRYARVLRGQAMAVRGRAFVEAARAAGASHFAILRGHILPHCLAPILVMATLGVGSAILAGSSLSFLGLGANDEHPDWGWLLTQGRGYMTVAWWTVTWPGLALTALVVSINLLGDALRRRLDPRGGRR